MSDVDEKILISWILKKISQESHPPSGHLPQIWMLSRTGDQEFNRVENLRKNFLWDLRTICPHNWNKNWNIDSSVA